MKKLLLTAALVMFTAAAANAEFWGGVVYNNSTTPGGGYTPAIASKHGESACKSFFGIVTLGDCSVQSAMKNGGIKSIAGYDVQRRNILGFQNIKVHAWGN